MGLEIHPDWPRYLHITLHTARCEGFFLTPEMQMRRWVIASLSAKTGFDALRQVHQEGLI